MSLGDLAVLEDAVPFPLSEPYPVQVGASPVIPLAGLGAFGKLASGGYDAPPWWSRARDSYLRDFWKSDDHISGAVYAMQAKMTAIPFKVLPVHTHIKKHAIAAERFENNLRDNSELFQGWSEAYGKFIIDLHTQDNGAFLLVMGAGPSDGPIEGPALGVMHLESYRCIRTNDPDYPVIYHNLDNRFYKLHFSRVIAITQMPSPEKDKHGVGLCAVSRALQSARRLIDVNDFARSKLGSKPLRGILAVNGITDENLAKTIRAAEIEMQNDYKGTFARIIALASLDQKLSVDLTDLASLPDGFNEEVTTRMAMYTISLAFGVDARELFPASEAGATKADAELTHQKARVKAPGHIISLVEHQINLKVMPPFLKFKFDFQDDEQDKFQAEIRETRAKARKLDIENGTMDTRTAREEALTVGDITQGQFNRMELTDGRLPDGTSVLALFYSQDKLIAEMLNLGVDNPFSSSLVIDDSLTETIEEREAQINTLLVSTSSPEIKQKAQQALAALKALRGQLGVGETVDGTEELGDGEVEEAGRGEVEEQGQEQEQEQESVEPNEQEQEEQGN